MFQFHFTIVTLLDLEVIVHSENKCNVNLKVCRVNIIKNSVLRLRGK